METTTGQIWYYEKDGQLWGPLYRAEIEILSHLLLKRGLIDSMLGEGNWLK